MLFRSGGGAPIAATLVGQGFAVTGLDASAPLLDLCRQRFPDGEWIEGDMRQMALGRIFDGLVAWDSFFHLDHDAQRAMFPRFAAHAAPGAALVTLTKVNDLLLSITDRGRDGRPVLVLDPFGLAPGLPELVWDPIAGCIDPKLAERRAKAFTAGTVKGAVASGSGDAAARFYAGESAKVLQAFFHAAALTGRSLEQMLHWVANPSAATEPEEILRNHPGAAPFWDGLLWTSPRSV